MLRPINLADKNLDENALLMITDVYADMLL